MPFQPVAHQLILRGSAASLSFTNYDSDGDATAAAAAVTVRVQQADGTDVIAAGGATTGSNPYLRALTAAQAASLDVYTATWSDAGDSSTHTTLHEIVGGYFFNVADVRAFDSTLTQSAYSDAVVRAGRREVEEECERITNAAWVPRFRRQRLSGTGAPWLLLPTPFPRRIRSVRTYTDGTNYETFDSGQLAAIALDNTGRIRRTDGGVFAPGTDNLIVEWEHGYDRPPAALRHASLTRLRHLLNAEKTGIPDRAEVFQFSPEFGGTFRLATPGRFGYETGIPAVDAVYERFSMKVPGLA